MAWPLQDASETIRFLRDKRTDYDSGGARRLTPPWPLRPRDYVAFARTDLRQQGNRGLVNALGNAKRALHCQVDSILYCAGLSTIASKERWSFPRRFAQIEAMGIATAGVLARVNRHRNEVEHDYVLPKDREWLEDLIDTVDIFVQGTEPFATTRYDAEFVRPFRRSQRVVAVKYKADAVLIWSYGASTQFTVAPADPELPELVAAFYAALLRTRASL